MIEFKALFNIWLLKKGILEMKKILLYALAILQSLSFLAMERPTSSSAKKEPEIIETFERLPREIFLKIINEITGNSLDEAMTNVKRYYIAHPASQKDVRITSIILSHLMQKFNFTKGKELQDVVDKLKKLKSLTVFENPEMKKWIGEQKKRLLYEDLLRKAVYDANASKVKELAAKDININAKDESGNTILMTAVGLLSYTGISPQREANLNEIIIFLLNNKAIVNSQSNQGNTALISAARTKLTKIVEMLLKNNADPNLANNANDTALIMAVWSYGIFGYSEYKKILQLLLEAGANPNTIGYKGKTVKKEILTSRHFNDKEKTELIDLLLKYGLKE